MAKSFILLAFAILKCALISSNNVSYTDFGFELLMSKQEQLEHRLFEIQEESKKQILQTNRQYSEQTSIIQESTVQVKQLLQNQNLMQRQISDVLEQQTTFANNSKIMNEIFALTLRKIPSDVSKLWKAYSEGKLIKSCKEVVTKAITGRFWLSGYGFEVYCLQAFHDGGWTVIQDRYNGLVNFARNWADYKEGFGDLDGEFWLGLDKIHQLTSSKTYELLVFLKDFKGVDKYAKYDKFAIGSENEGYVLKTISGYSGTAGDSLSKHKGWKFFTYDKDNDHDCANGFDSGWWYGNCSFCNLNAVIANVNSTRTMNWKSFSGCYCSLKVSRMMIRELK